MELTKLYDDAITTWNEKATADKTWVNLKTCWLKEYLKVKLLIVMDSKIPCLETFSRNAHPSPLPSKKMN